MKTWWDAVPGRLEFEVKELEELGAKQIEVTKDAGTGGAAVEFIYPHCGADYRLRAVFPPTYPNTRFEIFAPELKLERHQNPFVHNLCLLDRDPDVWHSRLTVARVLEAKFGDILTINGDLRDSERRTLEVPQGEPESVYLPNLANSSIAVSSDWEIPDTAESGTLIVHITDVDFESFKGIVASIRNEQGVELLRADDRLLAYPHTHKFTCRWVRSREPITDLEPARAFDEVSGRFPRWQVPTGRKLGMVALLRREEVIHRKLGDAWVFVVATEQHRFSKRSHKQQRQAGFARTVRYGRKDAAARVPLHAALGTKRVALIGVGALGSGIAVEFARSTVRELRLIDFDYVEPATTIRWARGFSQSGALKVEALRDLIERDYPFTAVRCFPLKIGAPADLGGPSLRQFEDMLAGCDLIVDAAVDEGVSNLLAEYARDAKLPFVCVSATPGAKGGRVVLIRPGRQGCWDCFLHARHDGDIPVPSSDENGEIRPVGCDQPTFTGANYDLAEVVQMGVRAAVIALSEIESTWDVASLSMNRNSVPSVPEWQTFSLRKHNECPNHS